MSLSYYPYRFVKKIDEPWDGPQGFLRDSRYLVGIGIYFGKPKKKETFIYNSS